MAERSPQSASRRLKVRYIVTLSALALLARADATTYQNKRAKKAAQDTGNPPPVSTARTR